MSSGSGDAIGRFLTPLLGLKNVLRRGWVVKLGIRRPESVADHCHGVALVAALMARAEGLDPYRAAFMAVAHDLHEIVTGDRLPTEIRSGERSALRSLTENLPNELARLIEESWEDYWKSGTPEARIVREADKLEMVAQALFYEKHGHPAAVLDEFWASAQKSVESEVGLAAFRALAGQRKK